MDGSLPPSFHFKVRIRMPEMEKKVCVSTKECKMWRQAMTQYKDVIDVHELIDNTHIPRYKIDEIRALKNCGAPDCNCEDVEEQVLIWMLKTNPTVLSKMLSAEKKNMVPEVIDNEVDSLRHYIEKNDSDKHRHLMKIYCLAPVMLGRRHQPEIWLQYMYDSKLIPVAEPNEGTFHVVIEERFLHVYNILDECISSIQKELIDRKVQLQELSALFETIDSSVFPGSCGLRASPRPLDSLLQKAKDFNFLHSWKNIVSTKQSALGRPHEVILDDRLLVVCLLFAARQYMQYAMDMEASDGDLYDEHEVLCKEYDLSVQKKKENGNRCFRNKDFEGAIIAYTEAIKGSRYNAILYGNRAQSYAFLKRYMEAYCDSLRSVVLDPSWHKGYYRCAHALFEMGRIGEAIKMTDEGIRKCNHSDDLEKQQIKFLRHKSTNEYTHNPHYRHYERKKTEKDHDVEDNDDDDCPSLASSSEGSDDDSSSSGSEKLSNPVYEKFKEQQKEKELKEAKRKEDQKKLEEKLKAEEQTKALKREVERKEKEKRKKEEDKRKSEEREKKRKEEEIRNKENEKKKKILREKQEKDHRHTQLFQMLSEGSQALLDSRSSNAQQHYDNALDFIKQYSMTYFERVFKEMDYVVVKYSMGDACIRMNTTKEIQQGMGWFREILDKHKTVKFPLAFLGLGRAYRAQNRFTEAMEPLRKGLTVARKVNCTVVTWPGTQIIIDETRPGNLVAAIQQLLMTCRYPPPADAVCRYPGCQAHYNIRIYINDPDLKGFVRLRCFARCRIEYHMDCWRRFKKDRISTQDKDYLNIPCLTSDCSEKIAEIIVYDHNGVETKCLKTPRPDIAPTNKRPPQIKMKAANSQRIAKKDERKAKRKEHRAQQRRLKEAELEAAKNKSESNGLDIIESLENSEAPSLAPKAFPSTQLSPVLVLRKEVDEPDMPVKTKKSKKRGDNKTAKTKMSLDEFVGNREAVYEDENGVLHKTAAAAGLVDSFPGSSSYTPVESSNPFLRNGNDNMTDSLLEFFEGILARHGPMQQNDVVIQRELEEFPQESRDLIDRAGGVGKFLIQSLKFALIDDVVCLMKDAVPAREIANGLRTPFSDRYHSSNASNNGGGEASVASKHSSATISSNSSKKVKSGPLKPRDILDTSQGGFPNTLCVINNKPVTSSNSTPIGNGNDLFAGLNFNSKPKTTLLDELDMIDDCDEFQAVVASKGRSDSLSSFPEVPISSRSVSSLDNRSETAVSGCDEGSVKKSLDDIDDESDITSSEDRMSESRSNISLPKSIPSSTGKPIINLTKVKTPLAKGLNELDSIPKKSLTPNLSNGDIARLDDFEEAYMPMNDSVVRNESHIQELRKFSSSISSENSKGTSPISKILPTFDISSKKSSPASSVQSWPVNSKETEDKPLSVSDISQSLSEPRPNANNSLTSSRLKDWLPKETLVEPKETETQKDTSSGGILENTAAWSKKKIDLSSFGGAFDDDDEGDTMDTMKPDVFADTRSADQGATPSPVRPEAGVSPGLAFGFGLPLSRSHTPDVRSERSLSPAHEPIPAAVPASPIGLPKASSSDSDIIGSYRPLNQYGAIGTRTDSPLSSRGSSKPSTPAHTPRPSNDPLPEFPSAHDAPTTGFSLPPVLTSIAQPPVSTNAFGITAPPGMEAKCQNTLFPTTPGTLFNNLFSSTTGPTVWGSGPIVGDSQPIAPLDGEELNASAKSFTDAIDNQFIREKTDDVYNSLKNTPTFENNPNLYSQIEGDIRRDLEHSKAGTLLMNGDSLRSNRNKAVQYDLSLIDSASKGCNTDPYEPNREELQHAHAQLYQNNVRLQDTMDKFHALKKTSVVEIRDLQSRAESSENETKGLRAQCKTIVDERDNERKRWSQEKRSLSDEVKSLKQQHSAAKSLESNIQAELLQKKTQFEHLTRQTSEDKEAMRAEREKTKEDLNNMRIVAGQNLTRAQNSEVKFLKLQMSVGNQILESTLKDCEMRVMQFTQLAQHMLETNQTKPAHMQSAEEQWRNNVKIIREMKDKYMKDHEEQIEAVKNGTPLNTLPELGLPKPPPPPHAPMPMPGRPMMPTMMSPMMPFMNTSPQVGPMVNGNGPTPSTRSAKVPSYPPGLVRPQATGQHKAKTSFEKIISQLSKVFPQANKADIMKHIQELRTSRGGSLTGMTMTQIVQQVAERMLQAKQAVEQRKPLGGPATAKFMQAASGDVGDDIFAEEEDPCMICFEELQSHSTTRLGCNHRYHTECIKKWFQEQSTCPMCRNHTLLPEEYPSLS